jgi:hypothetical protein
MIVRRSKKEIGDGVDTTQVVTSRRQMTGTTSTDIVIVVDFQILLLVQNRVCVCVLVYVCLDTLLGLDVRRGFASVASCVPVPDVLPISAINLYCNTNLFFQNQYIVLAGLQCIAIHCVLGFYCILS